MKKTNFAIVSVLLLASSFSSVRSQVVIQTQPISNLFDGNAATTWVSSFNGELFPIELEIQFGSSETIGQLMMRQTSDVDLAECKVDSFTVFVKNSNSDTYPATAIYSGRMNTTSSSLQWFEFASPVLASHLLLHIHSLTGTESTHAALSEVGIKAQRKNGSIASSVYHKDQPATWSGVSWNNTEPYQITSINWVGKTLMNGNFTPDQFSLLGSNYNFAGTGINVISGVHDFTSDNPVLVTPTVVDDLIIITGTTPINSVVAITMQGNSIALHTVDGTANASSLPSGFYVLVITTEKGSYRQKIIKR